MREKTYYQLMLEVALTLHKLQLAIYAALPTCLRLFGLAWYEQKIVRSREIECEIGELNKIRYEIFKKM